MKCTVTIKPNSKVDLVEKLDDELIVRTKAPAVEGKANDAATRLLARYFGVSKSQVSLVHGAKSRKKVFEITP